MRNITVSVPDEVYRQAKVKAAEQGRSVSALVAEYLSELGDAGDRFESLLTQQEQVFAEIRSFRAGDQLHHRAIR